MNRLAGYFFQRGHARGNFYQTAAAQRNHAAFNRFLFQFHGRCPHQNQFSDFVIDLHHFIQTAASFVAGVVADSTTFALLNLHCLRFFGREAFFDQSLNGNFHGLGTVFANAPDQTLGADQVDRGCDQKGLNTHVHQSCNGFRRAVGVQGRKYKVTGKRRFDSDFSGFEVADFADENDVGILTQEGAQSGGKVQADLLLHLYLIDAGQLEFDGIFFPS